MNMNPLLSFSTSGKPIPYPAVQRETIEATNHGFRVLKGHLDDVEQVPEAVADFPLRSALHRINAAETAFFTVGCTNSLNEDENGHWGRGYLEVSFNHLELASDCAYWLPLFQQFHQTFHASAAEPAKSRTNYLWELEPCTFVEIGPDVHGFTAGIWISIYDAESQNTLQDYWADAVEFVADFFVAQPPNPRPRIY